jgi:hypothetical protein
VHHERKKTRRRPGRDRTRPGGLARRRPGQAGPCGLLLQGALGLPEEFERLFLKNHYPLLLAQKKDGRIKAVSLYRPTFHGEGRADWTFMVVIDFASFSALGSPSNEEALARRLFPDQDTFKKEEQRRFEILDAHWDVPLTEVEAPVP